MFPTSGFIRQTLVATIGLGEAKAINELEVRWPDGTSDHFEDLASQHIYTIQPRSGIVQKTPNGKDKNLASPGESSVP
jgi:hypothetical protein